MTSHSIPELQKLDQSYHLHPFTDHTAMHAVGTHIIRTAEGCFVIDQKGRRLLDGLAGLWCLNAGYGRKEIIDAVTQQMKQVVYYPSFFNSTTEPPILLAERLAKLAPKRIQHTFFSNSGSEANESALKIIRAYWKLHKKPEKKKILSRTYAYHGVTLAAASMTGLSSCSEPFDLPLPGFIHVPGPYHYGANTNLNPIEYGYWCIEETERIIQQEKPQTIAALFAEPIQGAGGVIVPPEGYLKALRALCKKYEILFVADEVITGFGRLGDWFASNLWDLDPDLICLAKALTSGYLPLGATMVSNEITETIIQGGYFAHGFTYSGHPTPCAAALANLDLIEKEQLIPNVRNDLGPYFQQKLNHLREHPVVGEVRGYGLIGAIELLPEGGKANLKPDANLGIKGAALVREEGAIVRGIRNLLAVAPPLIITKSEIDFLFDSIDKALGRFWK